MQTTPLPQYSTITYNSPLALQRWFHNKRFEDAIKLLALEKGDRILDYGCGDGRLLELISDGDDEVILVGYEPVPEMAVQASDRTGVSVSIVSKSDSLDGTFNKIVCLETCEHLPGEELLELFSGIKQRATQDALIVFSVPVETGLPGAIKNVYRKLRGHAKDVISWSDIFKTTFGVSIERSAQKMSGQFNYYYSHVGFNHRSFERLLRTHFQVNKVIFSPFNWMKSIGGNTVYYVCQMHVSNEG